MITFTTMGVAVDRTPFTLPRIGSSEKRLFVRCGVCVYLQRGIDLRDWVKTGEGSTKRCRAGNPTSYRYVVGSLTMHNRLAEVETIIFADLTTGRSSQLW